MPADILADRPAMRFADPGAPALPLYPVEAGGDLPADLTAAQRTFAAAQGFSGALGTICLLPQADGTLAAALFGYGSAAKRARQRFSLAAAAAKLPEGNWRLVSDLAPETLETEALGWLLEGYRFDRYAANAAPGARLVAPEGLDAARIALMAEAEALTRDLINTPPNDMGPDELEAAARALAARHGAAVTVVAGEALLAEGYPIDRKSVV